MEQACSFFGHHDATDSVYPKLLYTIEELILQRGISFFMVGNHGAFDSMAYRALCEMRKKHPHIEVRVVLAYIPQKAEEYPSYDPKDGCIPDGIERIPRRFAILYRNKWMIKNSEIVVTYVTHRIGGAAKAEEYAGKQEKEIIALGGMRPLHPQ